VERDDRERDAEAGHDDRGEHRDDVREREHGARRHEGEEPDRGGRDLAMAAAVRPPTTPPTDCTVTMTPRNAGGRCRPWSTRANERVSKNPSRSSANA